MFIDKVMAKREIQKKTAVLRIAKSLVYTCVVSFTSYSMAEMKYAYDMLITSNIICNMSTMCKYPCIFFGIYVLDIAALYVDAVVALIFLKLYYDSKGTFE